MKGSSTCKGMHMELACKEGKEKTYCPSAAAQSDNAKPSDVKLTRLWGRIGCYFFLTDEELELLENGETEIVMKLALFDGRVEINGNAYFSEIEENEGVSIPNDANLPTMGVKCFPKDESTFLECHQSRH